MTNAKLFRWAGRTCREPIVICFDSGIRRKFELFRRFGIDNGPRSGHPGIHNKG